MNHGCNAGAKKNIKAPSKKIISTLFPRATFLKQFLVVCFFILGSKHMSAQGVWSLYDTTKSSRYVYPMDSIFFVLKDREMWRYSPASKIWERKADYPGSASSGTTGYFMSINGKAYFGAGYPLTEFWCYDPVVDSWSAKANFPGSPRNNALGMSLNGVGYMAKGHATITTSGSCNFTSYSRTNTTNYSDFYKYDPSTNAWTLISSSVGVAGSKLTGFSANGKLYFGLGSVIQYSSYSGPSCGGTSGSTNRENTLSEFFEYDPITNVFTSKAPLAVPVLSNTGFYVNYGRAAASAFSINNIGFVFGGYFSEKTNPNCSALYCSYDTKYHANGYIYDATKNEWYRGNPTPLAENISYRGNMLALGSIGYQLYNSSLYQLNNADLTVKVDSITGYRYCPNDSSFRVYYSTIGSLNANNKFEVEISNNNFQISSYNIGSKVTTDATGYIDAYITAGNGYGPPQAITGIPFPNGYEIRIKVYDDNNLRSLGARSSTRYSLNPVASPMFSATASVPACSNNNNFTFNNLTSPAAISYLWNFGDGTTSDLINPVKSYTTSGLFPVTLTVTNNYGCKSQITQFVSVNPSDSTTSDITACGSYNWNETAYTSSGTYYRTYTKVNGCDSVVTLNLTVNTLPIVSFSELNATFCTNDALVTLTGSPFGGTFSGPGISGNTFDPSTAGAGTHNITYSYTDVNGCSNSSSQSVTVTTCAPSFTTLNLTAFLEGLYAGSNTMRSIIYELGLSTNSAETDTVTVSLWSAGSLSNPQPDHRVKTVLHADGTASMQFPATVTGNEFYIAVKHRNHMETWSKLPVMFSSSTSYDFSNSLAQAYDDGVNPPMAAVAGGKFAFYGGDVNQDGTVDGSDMSIVDNDNAIFAFGYNDSDVSGDGATDGSDVLFIDNNQPLFLFYARPY